MPRGERALGLARRVVRRLSGSLAHKRTGYFFIWTRAIATRLQLLAERDRVPTGIEAVSLDDLPLRAPGAWFHELEPSISDAAPPPGWAWPPKFPLSHYRHAPTCGQGVVEIPGGVVFGWRGQFGPDTSGVLADACALWVGDERLALLESAAAVAVGVEELDGVTMSVWANGVNYAHSLLQSVPRLGLLRRAFGLDADRFLVHVLAPRPMAEAIEILGLTDRIEVVPAQAPSAYRCEKLRAATSTLDFEFGPPWVAEFLHELFLPVPPRERTRRLYLERGNAKRKVLNEADVLSLLEPAGFESIAMDGRAVTEQAELFASVEVIVASHGAALANLVFCQPGTLVVELMGTNSATRLYADVSWRRGLEYRMIMGTEPSPPERWWTWRVDADTVVDIPQLRRCLERSKIL